jgi:mannose-6-phosphate isomerase-like protein (cupin superfamily)
MVDLLLPSAVCVITLQREQPLFRKGRQAMPHKQLQFGHGFKVVLGEDHSRAAQLTLTPGEVESGPDDRHRGADQWLFVVAGTGEAVVKGETVPLKAGTLLLIERGDRHEIRNTGGGAAAHPERLRPARVYRRRGRVTARSEISRGSWWRVTLIGLPSGRGPAAEDWEQIGNNLGPTTPMQLQC